MLDVAGPARRLAVMRDLLGRMEYALTIAAQIRLRGWNSYRAPAISDDEVADTIARVRKSA